MIDAMSNYFIISKNCPQLQIENLVTTLGLHCRALTTGEEDLE